MMIFVELGETKGNESSQTEKNVCIWMYVSNGKLYASNRSTFYND